MFGKSDPYLEFAKQNPDGSYSVVHRTEVSCMYQLSSCVVVVSVTPVHIRSSRTHSILSGLSSEYPPTHCVTVTLTVPSRWSKLRHLTFHPSSTPPSFSLSFYSLSLCFRWPATIGTLMGHMIWLVSSPLLWQSCPLLARVARRWVWMSYSVELHNQVWDICSWALIGFTFSCFFFFSSLSAAVGSH